MKILFKFAFLLSFYASNAQIETKPSNNTITLQFAGTGGRNLSINYERVLVSKPKYKLAQTVGYSPTIAPNYSGWFTEVNWIFGQDKHHLFTGLSHLIYQQKNNYLYQSNRDTELKLFKLLKV